MSQQIAFVASVKDSVHIGQVAEWFTSNELRVEDMTNCTCLGMMLPFGVIVSVTRYESLSQPR